LLSMKALIALLLVSLAIAGTINHDDVLMFKMWMRENKKQYLHDEFMFRLENFVHGMHIIREHNKASASYSLGMNAMGDLSDEEFKQYYLGLQMPSITEPTRTLKAIAIPEEIDWEQLGAVTPVKDQAACGSCWAFSTTGSMEGIVFIHHGDLISLSEQQLVDCSSAYGNHGCSGGLMTNAFRYIIANKGLCLEDDYPYKAVTQKCATTCTPDSRSAITGFTNVAVNDEDQLKIAVAQQPISVALEADQSGFRYYKSGVFDGTCGHSLNHGVLCVGYGTEDSKMYWRVKNSWGSTWGDHGYIKLIRHDGKGYGQCGIAMMNSYPTF